MGKSSGGIRGTAQKFNSYLEEYISGDGMWINNWLRNNEFELNTTEKEYLEGLEKAVNQSLKQSTTLYRSVQASAIFGNITQGDFESFRGVLAYGDSQKYNVNIANAILSKVKTGTVRTEKGFMSTTKKRSVAEEWGGFSGANMPIVMKITAPKGTKVADLSRHRMAQNEVLIKRNTRYKIKRIYGKNGQIYVDVTIL